MMRRSSFSLLLLCACVAGSTESPAQDRGAPQPVKCRSPNECNQVQLAYDECKNWKDCEARYQNAHGACFTPGSERLEEQFKQCQISGHQQCQAIYADMNTTAMCGVHWWDMKALQPNAHSHLVTTCHYVRNSQTGQTSRVCVQKTVTYIAVTGRTIYDRCLVAHGGQKLTLSNQCKTYGNSFKALCLENQAACAAKNEAMEEAIKECTNRPANRSLACGPMASLLPQTRPCTVSNPADSFVTALVKGAYLGAIAAGKTQMQQDHAAILQEAK